MKAVLFYTVGLPGVGKTTLAHHLSFWLSVDHLRGDKIGLELFRFPTYSAEERKLVYEEMARRATDSLVTGRSVLYDAAVNTVAQRQALVKLAQAHGSRAVGIWVDVPIELAKTRAGKLRDKGLVGTVARIIPPHIFDQYAAVFERPEPGELFLTVSGQDHYAKQYYDLRRGLRQHSVVLPRLI